MEHTDEELIERFQKGDQGSLDMVFTRYKNRIFNFCLRILSNRSEAEDATSEVFLALVSNSYQIRAQVKFSTWAYTVARNNCLSRLRKSKHVTSLFTSQNGEVSEIPVKDNAPTPKEQLEGRETKVMIQNAIGKLPLEQKEAIILREYHDLSYSEIAEILSCSLEKVKVLIFRAREQLRVDLASLVREEQL
jgi:RNA polymerase sigma-70 factor (ECF subfamily)